VVSVSSTGTLGVVGSAVSVESSGSLRAMGVESVSADVDVSMYRLRGATSPVASSSSPNRRHRSTRTFGGNTSVDLLQIPQLLDARFVEP
jgi:hypothetical protein